MRIKNSILYFVASWTYHFFYRNNGSFVPIYVIDTIVIGNISSANRPLHANYENFNVSHSILIQGRAHERWKG
jgi:Na+-translocating ferredoxin:NAD+ oxidoreductase RnfE subunit